MKEFKFPSEIDYTEEFVDDIALIDARKDKRIAARKRRRIFRINVVLLCFLLLIGGTVGGIWWFNRVPTSPISALAEVIVNENFELLSEIVSIGVDLNNPIFDITRNEYNPPLLIAVRLGNNRMIYALVNYGADVNITFGRLYDTPLHSAAEFGSPQIIEDLIYLGANVNATNQNRQTPLHRAVYNRNIQVMEKLLEYVDDLNPREINDWTPLHHAAQAGRLATIETLINAGADVDSQLTDGWTALHLAANAGNVYIAEALLTAGADRNIENNAGDTPFDIAERRDNEALMNLLAND